jgi:hypothetical protein
MEPVVFEPIPALFELRLRLCSSLSRELPWLEPLPPTFLLSAMKPSALLVLCPFDGAMSRRTRCDGRGRENAVPGRLMLSALPGLRGTPPLTKN